MIFSYDQYSDFLKKLKSKGNLSTFKDWKGDKSFLLRHDIDLDVSLAYEVAKIEAENGIQATYFFLTTGNTYNILNKKNSDMIRAIAALGHEVGLHFDPTIYSEEEMNSSLEKEVEILSFAAKLPIRSISLHNPSVHGYYPMFEGYINAYDPKIFSDENYISDSRMLFRGKNIFEFLDNIKDSHVQILLHPMHFSDKGYGYDTILRKYINNTLDDLHEYFSTNTTYQEHTKGDLLNLLKDNTEKKS